MAHVIPIHTLVCGRGLSLSWQSVIVRYARSLSRAKNLPTTHDRVRYRFQLVFPASTILRQRYRVPPAKWLLPYYFLHIFHKFQNVISN